MHEATARGICRDYVAGAGSVQLAKEYGVSRHSVRRLISGEIHPEIHALYPGLRLRTIAEARAISVIKHPPPPPQDMKAIFRDAARYRELRDLGLLAQMGIIDEDN